MTVLSYLIALTAMSLALGYIDSIATYYVRRMPAEPEAGVDLLALEPVEALSARELVLEQTRQLSIVLVIVTVGIIAGRNGLQQAGTIVFSVGAWTVLRYAALRTICDWPLSFSDVDAVLYMPEAVHSPVWLVIVVALALAATGVVLVRAGALVERRRRSR